ncbi:MAG: DUF6220 domain-containing protein [Ktedonobacterales bacterium]
MQRMTSPDTQTTVYEVGKRSTANGLTFWAQMGYLVVAWVFVAFVLTQVFLAGLSIFVGPSGWTRHVSFGHLFGPLCLALLALALLGRLPRLMIALTALLLVLYACQYVLIEVPSRIGIPALSALHPVNALIIFGVSFWLARRSLDFLPHRH